MKRIVPPIFMLLLVVVITFAMPIDAQVKEEQQPVEPMATTTVLHTESLPEMNLETEPEAVEADDGLLTSPSGLAAGDLHLRHNLIGLEQAFIDAEAKHGVRADFLAAVAALESGWGRHQFRPNNIMGFGQMEFSSMEECIDTVRTASITTAKLSKESVSGITGTLSGQKQFSKSWGRCGRDKIRFEQFS